MKPLLLLIFLLPISSSLEAQNTEVNNLFLDDINLAFQNKSPKVIVPHMAEVVDIHMGNQRASMTPEEAAVQLSSFFKQYPQGVFKVLKKGLYDEQTAFVMGIYQHQKGRIMMYIVLDVSQNKVKIKEFDFGRSH
ncbi:DUF4783 domain-containing protein [Algivirga pacifica]|uniref:DUF4783 domain-containing protein n=1 Tax=Algivirga pacifica TaxID=1162670 RepID=A0ABP9D3L9_9BACT